MVRKSTCKVDVDVEREEIRIARRARQYVTVRGRHRLYFETRVRMRKRVRKRVRKRERVINEWTRSGIPGGRAHTPPSLPELRRRCTMYDVRGGAGGRVESEGKINSECVLRIIN